MFPIFQFAALQLAIVTRVHSAFEAGYGDDSDLTAFISRPDIKAPLLDVKIYDEKAVTPGLLFVAPYAAINQQSHASRYYQPCQTGPHIYDGHGGLIWSGACSVGLPNQNACDFRVYKNATQEYLSTIFFGYDTDKKGRGTMLNASYDVIADVYAPVDKSGFNMHEFNVLENGATALHLLHRYSYVDVRALRWKDQEAGWVSDMGFREVDIASGYTLFEWWALDHIDLTASSAVIADLDENPPLSWNWFHANSVNKNDDGDYLLSSRFTDCVYKISGKDGSVLWRLGGKNSSFDLQGFNFSRQHDAQWLSHDMDEEIITFLDNAGDSFDYHTGNTSSALIIKLNKRTSPMTAQILERIWRPDGQRSDLRGNFQLLPNNNALIGWSENSYISEHVTGHSQSIVMEARFRSKRFVTYRSYKYNFTGTPNLPPDLEVIAYGDNPTSCTLAFYVSWNGATDVAAWNFYKASSKTDAGKIIGSKRRTGFETVFYSHGYENLVYAEAINKNGDLLGTSVPYEVARLPEWDAPENYGCIGASYEQCGAGNIEHESRQPCDGAGTLLGRDEL